MTIGREPQIVINNMKLTQAEAMTVRVAIGAFQLHLMAEGLGEDETGRSISAGYQACLERVNRLMAQ